MQRWPEWWEWELELDSHLMKRMAERDFTDLDLRSMLSSATSLRRDVAPGRFVVQSRLRGRRWEIIVEPEPAERLLVVITACPVSP